MGQTLNSRIGTLYYFKRPVFNNNKKYKTCKYTRKYKPYTEGGKSNQ